MHLKNKLILHLQQKKRGRQKCFSLFIFLFILLSFPLSTNAQALTPVITPSPTPIQEGLHLITSPVTASVNAMPGTTITQSIKINNAGTIARSLTGVVYGFTNTKETGQPTIIETPPADNYFLWATITPKSFNLAPGEWKTIMVTFTIPKDAAFDYYYAITFVPSSVINEQTGLPTAGLKGGVATLIMLNVASPNAKRTAELADFTTDNSFYEYLPATFKVSIKNTGNIHLVPKGNIFLSLFNNDVDKLDVNKEDGAVLANSTRTYSVMWDKGFPAYGYKMQGDKYILDSNGNKIKELQWNINQIQQIRIGKFTAHVTMVYDDGSKDVPIDGEISFWVIPWKILLGISFVLLLLLAGIFAIINTIIKGIFRKK